MLRRVYVRASPEEEARARARSAGDSSAEEQALYEHMAPMLGIEMVEVPAADVERLRNQARVYREFVESERAAEERQERELAEREAREIAEVDAVYDVWAKALGIS
jgi:hypothetical protein